MLRLTFLLCLVVCALGGVPTYRRSRIVGGEPAPIEDYPYQVSVHWLKVFSCSGAIISENFALTAAHCNYGSGPSQLTLRAGSDKYHTGGTVYQVADIIRHELFNPRETRDNWDYDIALIRVKTPFVFGPRVRPIALHVAGANVVPGSDVDVSGWGTTSLGGDLSKILLHAVLQVVDQNTCKAVYGSITERMMCAAASGKDSCQFDLGDPLVENGELVGMVLFGYLCAEPGYPRVFSRVAAFRNWISTNAGI